MVRFAGCGPMRHLNASLVAGLTLLAAVPSHAQTGASLVSTSGFANFNTAGVVVTISGDTNRNAAVGLEWRPAGGVFRAGHPLARIDATRLVGSVFSLSPNTSYEVRLTLSDANGVTGPATAVVAVQTRSDVLPEPTLRRLFVATTGNDANTGTIPTAPLRTIQRAATLAQAGDLVLIQPGIYRETVTIARSGTATQPLVFRGAAAGAIVDGADATIAAGVRWTQSGRVHSIVTGFPTGSVVTEVGRLFEYGSLSELQALAAGAPGGFFFDGTRVHVSFLDGSTPASHSMQVGRLEQGFVANNRAFIRIENLEIRYQGASEFGTGVSFRNCSDCAVRTCRIHEMNSAGVRVRGGDRVLIENNDIFDTSIIGWPWSLTRSSTASDAIVFSHEVGRGHVVRRNTMHGTFDGMQACGTIAPVAGVTNETDIHDNVFFDHPDDALENDAYCANVRVWNNRISNVHMGVSAAPATPGPLWVVRNVVWRSGATRTSQIDGMTASALKINNATPSTIGPIFVYQNTFLTDAPTTNSLSLQNPSTGTFIRARNNVIAGTYYALYKPSTVPWDGNWNDLFTTEPTRFVSWQGTRYPNLTAFRAIGQEANGISAPPQLVNPAAGNFDPAVGSPLIDRGVLIPGINDVFVGAAPDIGAVEAGAPTP